MLSATSSRQTTEYDSNTLFVEKLNYEQIGQLPVGQFLEYVNGDKRYHAFVMRKSAFVTINKIRSSLDFRPLGLPVDSGWKIHVSVDSSQVAKAWDIIIDILIAHDVNTFKVIRKDFIAELESNEGQRGKVVTIYCFKEEPRKAPEQWHELITDLTKSLANEGINPGPSPEDPDSPRMPEEPLYNGKEVRIPGTDYCSYRYDGKFYNKDKDPNPMIYSNGEHIVINAERPQPITSIRP